MSRHYAMRKEVRMQLDQFYTPSEVAKRCVSLIPYLDDYDVIVEPSAGRGAFSRLFPNCYAYDLDPQAEGIIQQDWLTAIPPFGEKMLVVGKPPFGKRGVKTEKNVELNLLNNMRKYLINEKTFYIKRLQLSFAKTKRL